MDELKDIIKRAREAKGWSVSDLATRLKVSRQSVYKWENGVALPGRENGKRLEKLLDIPRGTITGDPSHGLIPNVTEPIGTHRRRVPLVDIADAGKGVPAVDPYPLDEAEDFLEPSFDVSLGTFALRISGDSMEPRFAEGEIILIDPAVIPHNGSFVVVELLEVGDEPGQGKCTFKEYVSRGTLANGQPAYDLRALNPKYPTLSINQKTHARIIGTVVEHRNNPNR